MNIESIFKLFPTQKDCVKYIERVRWGNKPVCPYCHSLCCSAMQKEIEYEINRYHCNKCNTAFSVLVGTIFQNSKLELQKWLFMIFLAMDIKKSMSSRQLADCLGINHKTAWSIQAKIRRALCQSDAEFLKKLTTNIGYKHEIME